MTGSSRRQRKIWRRRMRLVATRTTEIELTDLHKAAHDGSVEEIKELLESDSVDINHRCHDKTALEVAIISKNVPAALLLIDKGASLYFEHGRNALCAASFHGLKEVAQAAVSKGNDVNVPSYWSRFALSNGSKTYPIQFAAMSGNVDTVAYLLEQGANLNWFKVHPFDEDSMAISDNPFSVAWQERNFDIFLLLLDATLTYKSRRRGLACHELLSPLKETKTKERLAERLALWLEVLNWESFDPDRESEGLGKVVYETLELVFGVGFFLHGDSDLVKLLIQKNVPIPEFFQEYLRRHWYGICKDPSRLSKFFENRPTVLDIAFAALPIMDKSFDKECWLFRVLEVLSEKGLPFTAENIGRELGAGFLLQDIYPLY